MNWLDMKSIRRRDFIKATGITAGGLIWRSPAFAEQRRITIKDVRMEKGIAVESDDGTIGKFAGSPEQDLKVLERHLPRIRNSWSGKTPSMSRSRARHSGRPSIPAGPSCLARGMIR